MNQWPNGQANAMFPQAGQGHMNPAAMYNNLPAHNQFDLTQFTQGLQNGNSNSSTPAFSNQNFQPGSIVPAKRTHDGMSGSPLQNAGSRSQTPSYAAFQNPQQAGQQFPNAPTPYAHLQQPNSNNATPSPTMQNQQFRPPTQPQQQRMSNPSPSPFPQQQQGNFGNQMSHTPSQNPTPSTGMGQQNQMAGLNQQFNLNPNALMAGVNNAPPGQMSMSQMNAQKQYQMKLMQHQQQLRSGMIPPRAAGGQQQGQMFNAQQQMANGQAGGQMNVPSSQQEQAQKRMTFMKAIAHHAQQSGRQFNPKPHISGRPVDLYALWHIVTQAGGSGAVERSGHWPHVASKMGFPEQQYPTAAADLRQLHSTNVAQYERLWFAMRQQAKQEEARVHAQQMAGLGGPGQASPTRTSQTPSQPNAYSQFQQGQQNQMQPQSTPVQANAHLPQNGMMTPQQQMLQHRRASSVRKPEQMTPQAGAPSLAVSSPHSGEQAVQRSPSVKHEAAAVGMKNEEPRSTRYMPARRTIEWYGGYDTDVLAELGQEIAERMPNAPNFHEMGVVDVKAIGLSLASGIHSEVRYALDALVELSLPRIQFDLGPCEDLFDIMLDCAEDQVELLSEAAAEVSDALDLTAYEDVIRAARVEADTLQDVPQFGTHAAELDRAANNLIAITTIFRNLTFWENNHQALTSPPLIKWLSNTIRLLGTRNMLLRTWLNTQDFYKDMITFLSNTTQSLQLPSRDDALHILHFLLAFAPQPAPSYKESEGHIRFTSYVPSAHRYLPAAVDCLAKLLARQDPNRMFYKSIFSASSSSLATSESPLDLLTRAFALSISVLPDRSKDSYVPQEKLRLAEARKAFLSQGMLAADILTTLVPGNEAELARAWIQSEDGWPVGLLDLAALLSIDRSVHIPVNQKNGEHKYDFEFFRLIAQRALAMLKRLAERAGKGSSLGRHHHHHGHQHSASASAAKSNGVVNGDVHARDDGAGSEEAKWEGAPLGHTIVGALLMRNADKTTLGLLCELHDLAMQNGSR